jgi:hypothetical protein
MWSQTLLLHLLPGVSDLGGKRVWWCEHYDPCQPGRHGFWNRGAYYASLYYAINAVL